MSLRVSRAVDAGPTSRYPFGRDALTPFAIAVQGLALIGTLIYASADAIVIIRNGGSAVAPLAVAGYGAVTALAGFLVGGRLRRIAPDSELIIAEAAQWRAGATLSIVLLVGAGAAIGISATEFDGLVRYVDPVLVLIACALLAPVPIRLLRSGFNELLEQAPSAEIQERVHSAVAEVQAEFGLADPLVRMTKVGRKLYLEVVTVVEIGKWNVSDEDKVRRAIVSRLDSIGYELWANIELTTDPALAD